MTPASEESLEEVLAIHKFDLTDEQVARLTAYCRLLWKWNERINLTRHLDYRMFVSRDLVDVQQLGGLLNSHERVLDVGSGGGVPGLPLTIFRPDISIELCESVGKKAKILQSIVTEMGLGTRVHAARAESLLPAQPFDTLVARAVGPLWRMLKWFQPHWNSIGRLLVIKGPRWIEERKEARHRGYLNSLSLRCLARYPLAETESDGVILGLWPKDSPYAAQWEQQRPTY